MNRENWEQVKDIFQAALNRPIEERARFLDAACQGDESLRRAAESLLSSFPSDFNQQIASNDSADSNGEVAATPPKPTKGARIGHYEIVRSLGAGGIGEVYLAEDLLLKRKVALKFLSAQFVADRHQLARFRREAETASSLNHPNILTVYEIGADAGVHFIAAEFVDGRTLREILKTDELPLRKLLPIAVQTAEALAAAHAAGICHRDIKPENIMVRHDGYVKVVDFGLAKITEAQPTTNVTPEDITRQLLKTRPGTIMGTARYMSPEQTRGLTDVDARTDVWSLGVVLFEMIAGRAPFAGETVSDVIASILKTEPPQLATIAPDCPPELERIVAKALQKERDERYQVMKDFALDLKSLNRELDFSASAGHRTTQENAHTTADVEQRQTANTVNRQRFSFLHIFLILLAVASGVGALWWLFAPRQGSDQNADVSQLKNVEVVNWAAAPGEFYSVGSFSPDAKMIAYTSTKTGSRNIWIKQTAAGEAVQITKDDFKNEKPVWSPNGDELAFLSTRGKQAGIWRIPILGGSPKLVAAIENATGSPRFWSKTNRIYYELNRNLLAVNPDSGETKQVTDFDSKNAKVSSFNIASDEQQISYVENEGEQWRVMAKTLAGGAPKQLAASATEIKNTAWHPDNRRFFYSALVDGTFQIFVVNLGGGAPRQLSFGDRDSFVLNVSSDGGKILYGSAKEESDVWSASIADAKETTVAADIDSELWASVSPDNQTVAYQSIKNLSQGNKLFYGAILIKQLNSADAPTQLVADGFLPVWSPDGSRLAFIHVAGKEYRLETIRATGGEQKHLPTIGLTGVDYTLLPYNRIQTSDFSWSPDGDKIAYISKRNDQYNIWLTKTDGTKNWRLTDNSDTNLDIYCPLWFADGKRIAFTSKTDNTSGKQIYSIWTIDAETKTAKMIFQKDIFLRLIGWSQSGNELILASVPERASVGLQPKVSLFALEIETGNLRETAVLKDAYLYNVHLSPDKKTIAFVSHRDDKDDVWTIAAAGGEARKITSNNDSRLYFSSLAWSPDNKTVFFGKQSRFSLLSMLTNFK